MYVDAGTETPPVPNAENLSRALGRHRVARVRRGAATLAVTALCLAVFALAAEARSSYCSRTGDYCTQVKRKSGRVYLGLSTFSFRGRYRLCVTTPVRERTCRVARLRRGAHGIYSSTVRWSKRFPKAGRGSYRVRWYYGGSQLGPALSFRRGG
jgi:hypothetical protein